MQNIYNVKNMHLHKNLHNNFYKFLNFFIRNYFTNVFFKFSFNLIIIYKKFKSF